MSLTIIRYRFAYILPALVAMAIFRIPLCRNSNISFWKLMGTGKGGGFRKKPDWQQWVIIATHRQAPSPLTPAVLYGTFIAWWLKCWNCSLRTILLEPMEGHGTWDGKAAFGKFATQQIEPHKEVAVLTRATLRISKLRRFWQHVPALNKTMEHTEGLVTSLSIGEVPFIKQATFSVWKNTDHMKTFAYNMQQHVDVIKKTRREHWYREEMFVRFSILNDSGWGTATQRNQPVGG